MMTILQKTVKTTKTELRPCPCCGSAPNISESTTIDKVIIACSKDGCRMVEANNLQDAEFLWNQPRFTDR